MPKLVVEQGKDSGAEILVTDSVTAGRGLDCAIVLHDKQASRQHCRFEADGDVLRVKDLGSRNGILVNGAKVTEAELKPGDRVAVGGTVLRVAEGAIGPWSGKTVSGYRFLDKIGEGGMGEVYRAEQLSMRRFVAAKVLSARLHEDPKYVDRLLKEARAAAQFNHPGLIQVHDVVQAPQITFFSMELVQGKTLREHLRAGPVGVSQLLAVARQVAEALQYAHGKGIVHHDVKPENIMLSEDGRVKLADLGIAQPAGAQLQGSAPGKRTLLGTPQYMAPDQVTGDLVDPRFDLYSLGATCYHALSGRAPYRGATPEEIVRQLCAAPPQPLGSLVPGIPPDVIAFVEALMARDPDLRIPTAEQALRRIQALQARFGDDSAGATAGTGTGTGPVPQPHREGSPWPRRIAAGLLGVAALGGATYAVTRSPVHATNPPALPPSDAPVPAPPQPASQGAELVAEGEAARERQDPDAAESAFRRYLQAFPEGADRDRAEAGLTWAAKEHAERAAAADWKALEPSLAGAQATEQITRLSEFLSRHPRTRAAVDAEGSLARLRTELKARESERMAALLKEADALLEEGRTLARGNRFNTAIARLSAFRKAHPDLPQAKLSELEGMTGTLQGQRKGFWEDRLKQHLALSKQGQFGAARRILEDLTALPEEGWQEAVQGPLAELRRAMDATVAGMTQAAGDKRDQMDLAGSEAVYAKLAKAMADTDYAPRARAWQDRAGLLAAAHQAVLARIARAQPKDQYRITLHTLRGDVLGKGRIESATAGTVTVTFEDGAKTSVEWKRLKAQDWLDIYRHYLDLRETASHLWLWCLCWDRGLAEEADQEFEKAKGVLAGHPDLGPEFLRARKTP